MRANSAQFVACQALSRQARSRGLRGHFRARSNIIVARFGHVG